MDRRRQKRYGLVLAAVGFGIAAYLWWNNRSKDPGVSDNKQKKPIQLGKRRGKSRCIVVTQSIADLVEIDWEDLLNDNFVVIVSPDVRDFKSRNDIISVSGLHKIIECETETGLWACVRSLKKEELIVNPGDISVPQDINRYTTMITKINSAEELMKYLEDF